MSITSEITRIKGEVSSQSDLLLQVQTALEGKAGGGGIALPTLTNPAGPENIEAGYEAIDGNGEKIKGTLSIMQNVDFEEFSTGCMDRWWAIAIVDLNGNFLGGEYGDLNIFPPWRNIIDTAFAYYRKISSTDVFGEPLVCKTLENYNVIDIADASGDTLFELECLSKDTAISENVNFLSGLGYMAKYYLLHWDIPA